MSVPKGTFTACGPLTSLRRHVLKVPLTTMSVPKGTFATFSHWTVSNGSFRAWPPVPKGPSGYA